MTIELNREAIARIAALPGVAEAAEAGSALISLWPLTEAMQMDNDAKYAENLQVMFSGMMTQVLLKRSEEVDQSVAEAVYEGMDVLPGVDPEIIRTLMDANRAYDVMASYHRGRRHRTVHGNRQNTRHRRGDPNRKGNPRPHGEPLTHYAQRLRIRSRR